MSPNQPDKSSVRRPRWRRWLREGIIIVVLFTLVSLGVDVWRSRDMPSTEIPVQALQTIHQQPIDLKAMSAEKPVLIYFWATWCSACKLVSPTVNWLSDDYPVVSVAIRSGSDARLNGYMNQKEYGFPVINDEQGLISHSWGIMATPTVVIVRQGKVESISTGFSTPLGLWLRMLLAERY